jgi:transcriptional regulator with XRE-family HTH domain
MPTKPQQSRSYRTIPGLLRTMREEAGMTQRQLGQKLTKPQSWIYNCETANRRVDLAEFCAWCKACGVDPTAGMRRFLSISQ